MACASRREMLEEREERGNWDDFCRAFPDEEACARYLLALGWPAGFPRPGCGCRTCSPVSGRPGAFQCTRCRGQLSAAAGAAMHGGGPPLRDWFRAMWMATRDRRGVSASALAREPCVNWRSASCVLRRLRAATGVSRACLQLVGEIEVGDAYVGAPARGRDGRGTTRARAIVGVGDGCRCARVVDSAAKAAYAAFGRAHIPRSATVRSDALPAIGGGLAAWPGLDARRLDASDDRASPRAVRHVISNLKATLVGTCRGVAARWLRSYAGRFAWLCSHWGDGGVFRSLAWDATMGRGVPPGEIAAVSSPFVSAAA
ncbi:IS1595 family transposase [Olsenella uli]|uniref:transposase n=1 Tax=Olsenella uli TaxID=133926 RepID=UPI00195D30A4|nr:IS1595 family transposase [Olsenella uli]